MNQKHLIEKVLSKMSSACYTVGSMYHFNSMTRLKMIYFAYFHSVMEYGIIQGLSGKYLSIFNISRTGHLALM